MDDHAPPHPPQAPFTRRRTRKLKWILLSVLLSQTCVFLVVEWWLRHNIPPSTFLVNETYSERRHFVPVRDWRGSHYNVPFTIDTKGYRYMAHNGRDDAPVILFVGDSFVFGSGVNDDETIPARFYQSIQKAGRSERVINAGFPAYGPYNYLRRFQEVLEREKNVTCVFVGIFSGNDFADVYDEREQRESLSFGHRLSIFLANNVKSAGWVRNWWVQKRAVSDSEPNPRISRLREIIRGESPLARGCIEDGLAELLAIQQVAKARQIKTFYFYIPIPQQVTQEANRDGRYLKEIWPPDEKLLENIPGRMFLDFCAQHGMSGLDLSDAFRNAPVPITHFPGEDTNKPALMSMSTAHLSPEGCHYVAGVLFDWAFGGRTVP